MSLGVAGRYILKVKFGDSLVPLNSSIISECVIIKDIRKFLPEFRLSITDSQGNLTHLKPFDKSMSSVSMEVSQTPEDKEVQIFDFDVYVREPRQTGSQSGQYDITGMLSVGPLFFPQWIRSFNGKVSDAIKAIGKEIGIHSYDLSLSLDVNKILLQPNWTNAAFLNYTLANLTGSGGKSNYKLFVTVDKNKKKLVCKAYDEFVRGAVAKKYVVADTKYEDHMPAYNYEIMDNYKFMGVLGCKQQKSVYFDYTTGTWVDQTQDLQSVTSLTKYFAVDQNDYSDGLSYNSTGRNNDFTSDYKGRINSLFETRVNDLVKMWLTTDGDATINPGDVVRVMFPEGFDKGKLFTYQYAGDWVVERVVMSFGDTFINQILLSRSGIDTNIANTLVKATKVVR